jgi:hypothetical protein
MADVSVTVSLKVNKGLLQSDVSARGVTATMSSDSMISTTYSLSTNATSISTANLSTVGFGVFRNLSASTASTAQIGIEAGGSFVSLATLKASEPALFRLSTGVQYQAVGTAGTRLRVDIAEG